MGPIKHLVVLRVTVCCRPLRKVQFDITIIGSIGFSLLGPSLLSRRQLLILGRFKLSKTKLGRNASTHRSKPRLLVTVSIAKLVQAKQLENNR